MAKKKATAPAGDGEAIPERKVKRAPEGIPQELWNSWAITKTFAPGPNGEPSPEEQAAADEQAALIKAFRDKQFQEAVAAEVADTAAREERARERKQRDSDWRTQVDARLEAIEKALRNG